MYSFIKTILQMTNLLIKWWYFFSQVLGAVAHLLGRMVLLALSFASCRFVVYFDQLIEAVLIRRVWSHGVVLFAEAQSFIGSLDCQFIGSLVSILFLEFVAVGPLVFIVALTWCSVRRGGMHCFSYSADAILDHPSQGNVLETLLPVVLAMLLCLVCIILMLRLIGLACALAIDAAQKLIWIDLYQLFNFRNHVALSWFCPIWRPFVRVFFFNCCHYLRTLTILRVESIG